MDGSSEPAAPPSALIRRLAAAIAPGADIERRSGEAALAEDGRWLDALLARAEAGIFRRLWTNGRCLVATRRQQALPGFDAARRVSAEAGWPVFVRHSGGSTVVHRSGMLLVSRAELVHGRGCDLARALAPLADELVRALAEIGVRASVGPAPGSYCDGSANILVWGRKLAGLASLVRRRGDLTGICGHAVLTVEGDPADDVAAVERFEHALGLAPRYRADAHIALHRALDAERGEGSEDWRTRQENVGAIIGTGECEFVFLSSFNSLF